MTLPHRDPARYSPPIFEHEGWLAVRIGTPLPACCIRCGMPCSGRPLAREATWVPRSPWLALTMLLGVFPYLLFREAYKKTTYVSFHVCRKHRRQRWVIRLLVFLLSITLLTGGFLVAASRESTGILALALLGGLAAPVVAVLATRYFAVAEINEQYVYLKRIPPAVMVKLCHATEEFGNSLPVDPAAHAKFPPKPPA